MYKKVIALPTPGDWSSYIKACEVIYLVCRRQKWTPFQDATSSVEIAGRTYTVSVIFADGDGNEVECTAEVEYLAFVVTASDGQVDLDAVRRILAELTHCFYGSKLGENMQPRICCLDDCDEGVA